MQPDESEKQHLYRDIGTLFGFDTMPIGDMIGEVAPRMIRFSIRLNILIALSVITCVAIGKTAVSTVKKRLA